MFLGWIKDYEETQSIIEKNDYQDIENYPVNGSGVGKRVILTEAFGKLPYPSSIPRYRQNADDCVSMAFAMAVSTLMAVRIVTGQNQNYISDVATEPIHGGSRVEVNPGYIKCEDRGAIPAHAVQWLEEWGILLRRKYDDIDLTDYSDRRAIDWQCTGVPDELEDLAREHPVKQVALVKSYAAARDALANGYPVTLGSKFGFNYYRDDNGFSSIAQRSVNHYLCLIGIDDEFEERGVLCYDSYFEYFGGQRVGLAKNTFYLRHDAVNTLLEEAAGFTITDLQGFKRRDDLKESL